MISNLIDRTTVRHFRTPSVGQDVLDELRKQMPTTSPNALSRAEKDRAIQRGFYGLYRWYVDRSQTTRNWNPDRAFDWSALGQTHSPELLTIIEGFYGVEQYAPEASCDLPGHSSIRRLPADRHPSGADVRAASRDKNVPSASRGAQKTRQQTAHGLRRNDDPKGLRPACR